MALNASSTSATKIRRKREIDAKKLEIVTVFWAQRRPRKTRMQKGNYEGVGAGEDLEYNNDQSVQGAAVGKK